MRHAAATIALIALVLALPGREAAADRLLPGLYEIAYRLSLPHVRDPVAEGTTTTCLRTPDGAGLGVLSPNNPLARCPAERPARIGDASSFGIICPGGGAALASARYRLGPDHFSGVIEMKMGGKNMTMTETQRGRRIGDCP